MDWTHYLAGVLCFVSGCRWFLRSRCNQRIEEWLSGPEIDTSDFFEQIKRERATVPRYPEDTADMSAITVSRIQRQLIPPLPPIPPIPPVRLTAWSKAAEQQTRLRVVRAAGLEARRARLGVSEELDEIVRRALEVDFDD